jgi:hypothetical protein
MSHLQIFINKLPSKVHKILNHLTISNSLGLALQNSQYIVHSGFLYFIFLFPPNRRYIFCAATLQIQVFAKLIFTYLSYLSI